MFVIIFQPIIFEIYSDFQSSNEIYSIIIIDGSRGHLSI
jgi:hypothetical protein